jgi:lysophospholipase L1-like esterase
MLRVLLIICLAGCGAQTAQETGKRTMPLDVADLSGAAPVIWYDASDATTQTIVSGKVSAIADKQTGISYSQATSGKRPVVDAASLNSLDTHDYVRASQTLLANTGFSGLNSKSGASLVIAIRITDATSNQVPFFPANSALGLQQLSSEFIVYLGAGIFGKFSSTSTAWRVITARFDGTQTGNANRLKVWDNGVQKTLTFTGTVGTSTGSSNGVEFGALAAFATAEFDGSIAEVIALDYAGTDADLDLLTDYLGTKYGISVSHIDPNAITHTADNARFDYVGAWIADGTKRKTVCNGSSINFGFSGNRCVCVFDVSAASIVRPSIAYQVDDSAWTRVPLDSTGLFTITPSRGSSSSPAANYHTVRLLPSIESGYPSANNNYTTLRDAAVFSGVTLQAGKNLTKIAPNTNRIEFIGDSLTAGLRVLYTSTDNPAAGAPEINWPELVARSLGVMPVVMAHGGQGITTSGTDGFPAATASWRKAASGVDYSPSVEPVAVVIYYATNDSSFSQAQYTALLDAVRASCPNAIIFAVVPYNQSAKAATIQAAVNAGDANMVYLDYSSVIVSADTTDGTHHNPGGATKIATDLASDIAAEFAERGIALQAAGTGANTDLWDNLRTIARGNGLELIEQ